MHQQSDIKKVIPSSSSNTDKKVLDKSKMINRSRDKMIKNTINKGK